MRGPNKYTVAGLVAVCDSFLASWLLKPDHSMLSSDESEFNQFVSFSSAAFRLSYLAHTSMYGMPDVIIIEGGLTFFGPVQCSS